MLKLDLGYGRLRQQLLHRPIVESVVEKIMVKWNIDLFLQMAGDLWQLPSVKAAIVTIVFGIVVDIVRRIIVPKGRIAWGIPHNEHFILPAAQPGESLPINVLTRQIFIENVGRAIAEDIEITINFAPQHWHAFPPLVQIVPSVHDRFLRLQARMLNKREYFIVSMFTAKSLTQKVGRC